MPYMALWFRKGGVMLNCELVEFSFLGAARWSMG